MWPRTALGVGLFAMVMIACGGGGGSPSTSREPATDQSPTEPSAPTTGSSDEPAQEPAQEEPASKETSLLSASPACAPVGSRVVLKLGMTRDQRSVDCYDVDDVRVVFAPDKEAKITVIGPMSDGFCAIDVEVPKGAESGKIRVDVGTDAFESEATFPVPCPGS
jgi:hypothetical protein